MDIESETALKSPAYLSAEALLELDELSAGIRADAPALSELFHVLRTPTPSPIFEGNESVSMLADVRAYSILRDSLGDNKLKKTRNFPEFSEFISKYLDRLEIGVAMRDPSKIREAKHFCILLGENLIGKQMQETYENREKSDSRYVSQNAIL